MTVSRFIRAALVCDALAGVSAPETQAALVDDEQDRPVPLAAGPDGPWLPGTSVAGSLRAHLGRAAGLVMGSDPPSRSERGSRTAVTLTPSALRVLGTRIDPPDDGGDLPVRWATAIDRSRGAARPKMLRGLRRLPVGTRIVVWMRLDDQRVWPALSDALPSWRPVIGGGLSRGFGRTHLTEIRHGVLDFDRREDLARWLRLGGPTLADEVVTAHTLDLIPPAASVDTFRWQVVDALHVGSGDTTGTSPKIAAIARLGSRPVVPGSTWKGVLRARVEYVLRSCGQPACVDATCGTCAACQLFGFSRDAVGPHTDSVGRRGLLSFDDAPVTGPADGQLAEADRTHVAIDRITGGARDQLLYSQRVVENGTVTLTVRPLGDLPPWANGLLLLAIRDIHDGYVGVGAATTRGHGTLRLADAADLDPLGGAQGALTRRMLAGQDQESP